MTLFWVVMEDHTFEPPIRTWINGWLTEQEAIKEKQSIESDVLSNGRLQIVVINQSKEQGR